MGLEFINLFINSNFNDSMYTTNVNVAVNELVHRPLRTEYYNIDFYGMTCPKQLLGSSSMLLQRQRSSSCLGFLACRLAPILHVHATSRKHVKVEVNRTCNNLHAVFAERAIKQVFTGRRLLF